MARLARPIGEVQTGYLGKPVICKLSTYCLWPDYIWEGTCVAESSDYVKVRWAWTPLCFWISKVFVEVISKENSRTSTNYEMAS